MTPKQRNILGILTALSWCAGLRADLAAGPETPFGALFVAGVTTLMTLWLMIDWAMSILYTDEEEK